METLPPEVQTFAIALAASLALGVPVRLFGARATFAGLRATARFFGRRKRLATGVVLLGAAGGLWSMQAVRDLVYTLIF